MTKKCYKCNQAKSLDKFYKKTSNTTDKLSGRCKKCDDILKTNWRKNNFEKVKAYEKGRWRNGKKRIADITRTRQYRLEITDSYIRELATKKSKTLDPEDLSDEFVEAYRLNLKIKRALKLTPKWKGEEGKP